MYLAKAPTVTILIPVRDSLGVLRFPHSGGPYYGIHKSIDSSQTLAIQTCMEAETFLGQGPLDLTPVMAIDPVLKKEGEVSSVLYLLRPNTDQIRADKNWPTMANILRALPQGGIRLAYMKALQLLAGAADADVSVLEVDDEVRARLKEQEEPSVH